MIGERIALRSKSRPRPIRASPCASLLPTKRLLDDPSDLLLVHQVEAAPPALELEEALGLGVDLGEQVVILVPERVGGIEVLEVLDEVARRRTCRRRGRSRATPATRRRACRRHSASDSSPSLPAQYDIGAPLMTIGPGDVRVERRRASSPPSRPGNCRSITGLRAVRMALVHDAHELGFGVATRPRASGPASAPERR